MPVVVADASPLVGLVKIGRVDVLPRMFGSVTIPPEVAAELADPRRPADVRAFVGLAPAWLVVRAPTVFEAIVDIHAGERAAISLAVELGADLLLIDETKGREAAAARGLRTAWTAAVLYDAATQGLLPDLKGTFDRLKATNFRVPPKVLDELLARFERTREGLS